MVKHVVKGEKLACSTLEAGKNKPIMYIAKTRDFVRICEINKEKTEQLGNPTRLRFLVRVFITDLIARHSAKAVETYSKSTENACVYKEFCNTKGI